MNSPQDLARMLMIYYSTKGTADIIQVNMICTESDNEYILEILTQIYLECYNMYTRPGAIILAPIDDVTQYIKCLNMVFISLGYVIHTESIDRDKIKEYVPFAKILDGKMTLNPYHPMRIRENVLKILGGQDQGQGQDQVQGQVQDQAQLAPGLHQLYSNRNMLPNCIIIHDIDPNDNVVMSIKFQAANIH